jgi:pullulanase
LRAIKPDILLYGEGWTAGASPLPDSIRALKKNAYQLSNIAVFSDDLRDAIKGSVFESLDRGFATGKSGMEESIKFGITAACQHPQVDYSKVNYSKAPYAKNPSQVISYVDCHDNNILWDKLAISNASDTTLVRREMHKLALTIVLTSQGIPFLHAGTEFLRSKKGVENSFNSSDEINKINWFDKADHFDVYQYVRSLIMMRKDHPAFRLTSQKEIANLIDFKQGENGLVGYEINGKAVGDEWSKIFIVFNGSVQAQTAKIPAGNWTPFVWNNQISGNGSAVNSEIALNPHSAAILYQK